MTFCLLPIISPLSVSVSLYPAFLQTLNRSHSHLPLCLPPSSLHESLSPSCFLYKTLKTLLSTSAVPLSFSSSLFISHNKHEEAVFCCFQYLFCIHQGSHKQIHQVNIRLLLKNRLCRVSVVDLMMDMMQFDWWFVHCRADEYTAGVCKALNLDLLCCDSPPLRDGQE